MFLFRLTRYRRDASRRNVTNDGVCLRIGRVVDRRVHPWDLGDNRVAGPNAFSILEEAANEVGSVGVPLYYDAKLTE